MRLKTIFIRQFLNQTNTAHFWTPQTAKMGDGWVYAYDVTTEITPTERAAMFRFTFPENEKSWVMIDAFDKGSYIKIIPLENKVIGYTTRNSGGVPDPSDNRNLIFRAGNTLTQRSMRTTRNEATTKIDISGIANGQYAGLCHYASTYSTFGVKQTDGIRTLVYDNNGKDTTGIRIVGNSIWLKSIWGYEGINSYAYSTDGKTFIPFGDIYQLTWGNYRGDRIGIFNFNAKENKGFVDVDWFHYQIDNK